MTLTSKRSFTLPLVMGLSSVAKMGFDDLGIRGYLLGAALGYGLPVVNGVKIGGRLVEQKQGGLAGWPRPWLSPTAYGWR
jgi:hypothetical protein